MKFVLAADGSAAALDAARLAAKVVDPDRDRVVVYFSPLELEKRMPTSTKTLVDGAAAAVFAEVKGLLPGACGRLAELVTTARPAAVGILAAAAEAHAELIVVGARGHSSLQRFLLGSVSRAVVHGANLPVLVARAAPPSGRGLRVLICHHPASAAAVTRILDHLHWPDDTDGRVLGVAESMLAGPLPPWLEQQVRDPDAAAIAEAWRTEHEAEVRQLGTSLASFREGLPQPLRGESIVLEGNPAERILERAQADGTDLIVMGRAPSDAFSRWLLGSTSEAVLTQAHAAVLIVPTDSK